MNDRVGDVAFSNAVKKRQEAWGSRLKSSRSQDSGRWRTEFDDGLLRFLAKRESCYISTSSADGQPYVQHRGGPPGFLKAIDRKTLAFADFAGNGEYITIGNLSENDRAHIVLMDYSGRRRIKLWGTAEVLDAKAVPEMMKKLTDPSYGVEPERAVIFNLQVWTMDRPQRLVRLFAEQEVSLAVNKLHRRIAELEAELAKLKQS
jgi:predicted pyridoxine 5'-phosphate oxidase superfamily flavin-nucleotide-binding protein